MTDEPGEHPLFSVVSGRPSPEELAALTAVVATRLAARQRAAHRGRRPAQPGPPGWTVRR